MGAQSDVGACEKLGINPPPKITVIVVGKRHHVRFFPTSPETSDKTGNCRAGTVVDRDVGHPTEFDFYLQSHGGLLGTSRPAHYNVLLDENNFKYVLFDLFLLIVQSSQNLVGLMHCKSSPLLCAMCMPGPLDLCQFQHQCTVSIGVVCYLFVPNFSVYLRCRHSVFKGQKSL